MYTGHVYHAGTSAPIAGICVTDGRNIVRTDADGAFELPGWERAHVISVGALTHCHTDWFAMIDGHEGEFDFSITPADTEAGHSFLHISDTEITEGCGTWLDFVKRCVREEHPGFLIQTGDICRIRGLENHWKDMNNDTMGCPVRYTLGNHDYVDDRYGEYSFERLYGPIWYSFDFGNVHYIILPIKSGEAPGCYAREDSDIWLKKDLEMADPAKKVVFFCHDLCAADEDGFTIPVQGELLDLKQHNLLAWCFGHYHIHLLNDLGGIYNICTARPDSGGIDSSPAAVRKTTIHDDGTLSSVMLYNDIAKAEEGDCGVWRTRLDNRILFSTPLYADGAVFAATFSDGFPKNTAIYRLDAADGTICWKYDTVNGIKNDMDYADGRLYAQDSFGWVYCLDAEDGRCIWKVCPDLGGHPHHTDVGVLVSEGMVFTGSGRKVNALSAETGEILWSSERNRNSDDSPTRFVRFRDMLLVSPQWYGVYALDIHTGKRIWENRDPWYRTSTPGVWGNMLYAINGTAIACIEAETGITVYKYTPEPQQEFNTASTPLRDGEDLYLCTTHNGIVRYSGKTLQQKAVYPCGPSIVSASPYVASGECHVQGTPILENGKLIYASSDGYLYICDAGTTEEVQKFHIGAPSFVSPVRAGDNLITADLNGRITAYAWKCEE